MNLTNKSALKPELHDPLKRWKELKASTLRVGLVNDQEFYSAVSRMRLVRGEFGMWTLQLFGISESGYPMPTGDTRRSTRGIHILVDGSTREELMNWGVPVYLEEGKKK